MSHSLASVLTALTLSSAAFAAAPAQTLTLECQSPAGSVSLASAAGVLHAQFLGEATFAVQGKLDLSLFGEALLIEETSVEVSGRLELDGSAQRLSLAVKNDSSEFDAVNFVSRSPEDSYLSRGGYGVIPLFCNVLELR